MNSTNISNHAPGRTDPEREIRSLLRLLEEAHASGSSQKVKQVLEMLFIFSFHSETCHEFLKQWIDNVPNISASTKQDLKTFFEASERLEFAIAELSIVSHAMRADLDETAPIYHPRVPGGGQNDPVGLHYKKGRLCLFVQHNPYGEEAGNTCWTAIIINSDGTYQAAPRPAIMAGDVRGEEFTDAFSGSVGDIHGRRFAVYTIVGEGEKSFEYTPPNVLVFESSEREGTFENKRHPITWLHTFQNSWDNINQGKLGNLYDCRDPFYFEREGKKYILLGATTIPGRVGSGAVALLTSDGKDLTKSPWLFIGLAFKQIVPYSQGGAGIYECPSISHDCDSGLDILIVSIQRRPDEGNLREFHHHQAVWCWIGRFSVEKGFVVLGLPEGEPVNYGKAEYACAVTERPDGRNTIIGDLNFGDRQKRYDSGNRNGWYGCLSLPRIMTVKNNRLYQEVDPCVKGLGVATVARGEALELNSESSFTLNVQASTYEFSASVTLLERQTEAKIVLQASEANGIKLYWNGRDLILEGEKLPVSSETWRNNVKFRVFVDRSVIEVFSNGRVLSKIVTPERELKWSSEDIYLSAVGGKVLYQHYSVYKIKNACIE